MYIGGTKNPNINSIYSVYGLAQKSVEQTTPSEATYPSVCMSQAKIRTEHV